jgi:transcriptional regulator with GAF, ATPase, and Fis domain
VKHQENNKSRKNKTGRSRSNDDPSFVINKIDQDLENYGKIEEEYCPDGNPDDFNSNADNRRSVFEELLKISASINSAVDWKELVRRIVDAVILTTDCERGFLMLRDSEGGESFAIGRTRDKRELDRKAFNISWSVVDRAVETGEPLMLGDVLESDDIRYQKSIIDLKIKSVFCVPLKYEDRPIGAIYVDSGRLSPRFSEKDVSILEAFGAHAAVAIENARRRGELEDSVKSLKRELVGQYEFSGIIGRSKALIDVIETVKQVAPTSSIVHLHGGSGTGKELIARAIHQNSHRREKPFMTVDCGSLPEGLLQSELFGHTKGAFTGADKDRVGMFEQADGGTLFLDEIGEMPMKLQAELLRAIQENEVRRMGENHYRKVDVRVISATNRDLTREMKEKRFREDLYYRLYVVPITIPSLKNRPEDILPLAEYYLDKYSKIDGRPRPKLDRSAKELLLIYGWPGNVRELQNIMQRVLALLGDSREVTAQHLEPWLSGEGYIKKAGEGVSLKDQLSEVEAELIRKTLVTHSWNVAETAEALGVTRQVIYIKIKKFNLNPAG